MNVMMARVAKSYRTNRLVTRCLNFNQDCFLSLFLLFFFFLFCSPSIYKIFSLCRFRRENFASHVLDREGKIGTIKNDRGDHSSVNFQCCGCLVKFNDIGIFLCSTSINGRNELTKVVVYGLMNFWYNALV